MIATALLAAASVIVADGQSFRAAPPIPMEPSACRSNLAIQTRLLRPQDMRGKDGAQTLASLPPARLELPVSRSIAGCTAPLIIREDPQGDGRFARPR